jgi:hypothetical protein
MMFCLRCGVNNEETAQVCVACELPLLKGAVKLKGLDLGINGAPPRLKKVVFGPMPPAAPASETPNKKPPGSGGGSTS